jgi:hypothetical protein
MHTDDAAAFLVDYMRNPRSSDGYPSYGYEIYLPNVISAYLVEVEHTTQHHSQIRGSERARAVSPMFYEAAWELCRRGVLRPGVQRMGGQSDGGGGDGYCITAAGRAWIGQGAPAFVMVEPNRLGQLFAALSPRLGRGFQQRANEAVGCHQFGSYLACCAMCGAAAESILLAVAIAKSGNEGATIALYRAASGRQKVIEQVVGQLKQALASPFRSATQLLSYWRDEAAHGIASNISEIEAHEAVARLLRFAQFACDNWDELTS